MAMINCPECGKEISDKAKTCIHCGCPIGEESGENKTTVANVVKVEVDHQKNAQKKLLISTILSLIGSIAYNAFIATFLFEPEKETPPKADVTVTVTTLDPVSDFLKFLETKDGMLLMFVLCLLPFVLSLLTFLIKGKGKKAFCGVSVASSVVSSVLVMCFYLTDNGFLCFAPLFFIPVILFLVSAFLNILSTKEYFKNAE